jgi:hypothetical protein
LQKNDNNILDLLVCENNDLFLKYFKEDLKVLIQNQPQIFSCKIPNNIPKDFFVNHVCATFVETVRWWIENGMKEDAEKLLAYFLAVI